MHISSTSERPSSDKKLHFARRLNHNLITDGWHVPMLFSLLPVDYHFQHQVGHPHRSGHLYLDHIRIRAQVFSGYETTDRPIIKRLYSRECRIPSATNPPEKTNDHHFYMHSICILSWCHFAELLSPPPKQPPSPPPPAHGRRQTHLLQPVPRPNPATFRLHHNISPTIPLPATRTTLPLQLKSRHTRTAPIQNNSRKRGQLRCKTELQ